MAARLGRVPAVVPWAGKGEAMLRMLLLLISLGLAASAQAGPVSGTWSGDFLGHPSAMTLDERADGRLIGFLLTDPNARIVGGSVSGKDVVLEIDVADPLVATQGTFVGTIHGKKLAGTFTLGGVPTPVSFVRVHERYTLESWVMGEEEIQSRVLRLRDKNGGFLSGGYVGIDDCEFLSCAGDFTAWDVAGTLHTLTASSGGGCPLSASLLGTWDALQRILSGTYTQMDCGGPAAGSFIAGKGGVTDARDLGRVLDLLADFADRVEAESPMAIAFFSPSYLNDGKTRADWQSDLAALYADYDDITVQIAGIDEVATTDDGEVNPLVGGPPRVGWRVVVTGTPSGGGAVETVADEVFGLRGNQQLALLGEQGGHFVFVGNGYSEPFAIDLPIASLADSAHVAYGLWPFGVHGGGHPEGHPGWDVEFTAGAQVHAAADGTVASIEPNDGFPGQQNVTIQHRPGYATRYDHLTNLQPGIVVGASVADGDVLGDPGSFAPGFHAVHFALTEFTESVCPTPALTPTAQTLFDSIWADAAYNEELTEPFPCNPLSVSFPLVRTWQRTAGGLAPRIDFSRASGASLGYGYVLRDAGGAVTETGSASIDTSTTPASIDLVPDGGGATHLGVYRVVSGEMLLDWNDLARPGSLAGASSYESSP